MSKYLDKTLPVSPRMCLLEEYLITWNIKRRILFLYPVMGRVDTAATTIHRYWKLTEMKHPEMKERVNYMTKTGSYESMVTQMTDRNRINYNTLSENPEIFSLVV